VRDGETDIWDEWRLALLIREALPVDGREPGMLVDVLESLAIGSTT